MKNNVHGRKWSSGCQEMKRKKGRVYQRVKEIFEVNGYVHYFDCDGDFLRKQICQMSQILYFEYVYSPFMLICCSNHFPDAADAVGQDHTLSTTQRQ